MTGFAVVGSIFGAVWLFGFIASLYHVEVTRKKWWQRIVGYVLLFFVWPIIAWFMMRQMG